MRRAGSGRREQTDIDGIQKRSKKVKKQSSSSYNKERQEDLVPLKPLLQEEESRREDALVLKVQQCKRMFDFSDATIDIRNKEIKRSALYDIVEYLVTQKIRVVTERTIKEIVDCARVNMFRDMNSGQENELDLDEDEPILEESWPHLSSVYEMLLKLIEHPEFEPKVAKKYIDQSFIQELLRILNSTDAREREMIKTILHRIYGRFLGHRAFIRKAIAHTFLAFIFENLIYRGVSELLEILSSIINGFALPLKQEHVDFLKKVLIPLHRSYYLTLYIDNLTTCIEQYIEKDPELTPEIVSGLLHIWPKINSPKELAMLNEMEELIEKLGTRDFDTEQNRQDIFKKFMKPLYKQMVQCCVSTNFQVAEKALCLWNNDAFLQFFEQHNSELMHIVLPPLYASSKSHWNPQIGKLMTQVLRALMDINSTKYDEILDQAKEQEKKGNIKAKGQIGHVAADRQKNGSGQAHRNSVSSHQTSGSNQKNVTVSDKPRSSSTSKVSSQSGNAAGNPGGQNSQGANQNSNSGNQRTPISSTGGSKTGSKSGTHGKR